MSVAEAESESEAGSTPSIDRRWTDRPWLVAGWAVTAVLALIPLVRMVQLILDGSALQYNDYWIMLPNFANADGSLSVSGLFEFQNHPVVIPQLVYWLNIQLLHGSNISLGFIDVALALGTIAVIVVVIMRSSMRPWERMVMVVLTSTLLFSMVGSWNYVKAMSGTAWFSANLFAVVAVYLRSRGRVCWAFGLGVLAAVSYGTGVVVWLALIAAGIVLRPPRAWWRELPYAGAFVVTFLWYRSTGESNTSSPALKAGLDAAADLLVQPLGIHTGITTALGYVMFAVMVGLAIFCVVKVRTPTTAAFAGITAFGVLATVLLGYGRYEIILYFGEQSRYTSLPALAWIGFAGLAFGVVDSLRTPAREPADRGRRLALAGTAIGVAICVVVGAFATLSGSDTADEMRRTRDGQFLREIALRSGAYPDGSPYLAGALVNKGLGPIDGILRSTSHYPYVDGWDLDCGLLGKEVPGIGDDPGPADAPAKVKPSALLRDTVEISGRAGIDDPIRCIVVVGPDDVAVGAGTVLTPDPAAPTADGAGAFTALATADAGPFRVYAIPEGDGAPVLVGTADKGA